MKTFKIFGLLLLATVSVGHAQDINQAKKAIDAEKYEEAKTILKSILQVDLKEYDEKNYKNE